MAGLSLSRLLRGFPEITVNKVEYLTNVGRARQEGVLTIPTLVSGEERLVGLYLTKKSIRRFLEAV